MQIPYSGSSFYSSVPTCSCLPTFTLLFSSSIYVFIYGTRAQIDFKPVLLELLSTHPGLEFLQSTPEFQERYGMFAIILFTASWCNIDTLNFPFHIIDLFIQQVQLLVSHFYKSVLQQLFRLVKIGSISRSNRSCQLDKFRNGFTLGGMRGSRETPGASGWIFCFLSQPKKETYLDFNGAFLDAYQERDGQVA